VLKINPKESYIRLTDRADRMLRHLQIGRSTRQRYRDVVGGLRGSRQFGKAFEESWLAEGVIDGKPVVMLVVRHPGSPEWDFREETVSVRGVWSPEEAADLLAQGKGLLPFVQILKQGNYAEDNSDN